jgi:hypothetical protein
VIKVPFEYIRFRIPHMKNISLFLLLLTALASTAQNEHPVAIKLNYLSPLMNAVNVQTEFRVTPKGSFNIGVFYGFGANSSSGVDGWGTFVEYRFHANETAVAGGMYLAPYLRYRDYIFWTTYEKTENGVVVERGKDAFPTHNIDMGVVFGHQWLIGNRVLIDIYSGPGIKGRTFSHYHDPHNLGDEFINTIREKFPFTFRFGTTIGFRF